MMKKNNLEKKLEEISLPDIKTPGHKERLKTVLLERYYKEKRNWEIFDIFKKAIPLGATAIIIGVLVVHNLLLPTYNLAQAKKIAVSDSRIQTWIEQGATIQGIEVINNKGYVLIQTQVEASKGELEIAGGRGVLLDKETLGALAEIDLKNKEVSNIRKLQLESYPLDREAEIRAREIAERDPRTQEIVPKEAQIKKIVPTSLPKLKLTTEQNSIKIITEPATQLEAKIIYELNSAQWETKVDLTTEKVEEVNFLGGEKE